MNTLRKLQESVLGSMRLTATAGLLLVLAFATVLYAQTTGIPGRPSPSGSSVPNPGTQQQELPNITFPAPYNVFEFPVTCMACHGGTIDQTASHSGNWAGSNMASATRDPVFRANEIIINNTLKRLGADGAGNFCFRCHSPNGWLSGRFDPKLGGAADGSDIIQSILLSTDSEGVQCEQCHRAIGAVTMKRADLDQADPAWNMLSGLYDWPHSGLPYPAGPTAGNPYGESTLQYHDGMSYGAKYGGNMEISFNDQPVQWLLASLLNYTGQTYGIIPWWYTGSITPPPAGMPTTNAGGEVIHYNQDGSVSFVFEGAVKADDLWGATSPEHSTRESAFVKSPEFCGSCHEVTVPIMNHGMYEQRTYTEWKYSAFGQGTVPGMADTRCQGCHMPAMKHEYSDTAQVSLNPDPVLSGWYPYAKDRNTGGGTSFHKLAGGNRDLPQMMKILYPEVDLEVVGAPTGHDPMIFPGMFSDRGPMWDRAQRNTEISLRDGVSVQITQKPTLVAAGTYQVKVKVTNNTGHKIPSGYPDGRRMWIRLVVTRNRQVVYESGHYDPVTARLYNDSRKLGLDRALVPNITGSNSGGNAVMIYEKRTGTLNSGGGTYKMSPSILNETVLFDNRIPPLGFSIADYQANGASFWKYAGTEASATPVEDPGRFTQNSDEVTYVFPGPANNGLSARAEIYYEAHSREFMDYLNTAVNALAPDDGPRPEGPPNPMAANYPLTPTYLSDSIQVTTGTPFAGMKDLDGGLLQDNWGGIAYAAWLLTGKGAPFVMAAADTDATAVPPAPGTPTVSYIIDPATGVNDPNLQRISWSAVTGADGYIVSVRYGVNELTSDWDRLALLNGNANTSLDHVGLNPGKTFVYKVQAFNAFGIGPESLAVPAKTPSGLPLPPLNTRVTGVTGTTVTLSWYDEADNETGFIIQRQLVLAGGALGPWVTVGNVQSQTPGPSTGGNSWTDTGLTPNTTYNYQVAAYNASGPSTWDLPVSATTTGLPPAAPSALTAQGTVSGNAAAVQLAWVDNANNELGFRIQRTTDPKKVPYTDLGVILGIGSKDYTDTNVAENTNYYYRVYAFNTVGTSPFSNTASAKTPIPPPAAPTGLNIIGVTPNSVTLGWNDNSTNETGFEIWMTATPAQANSWKRQATVGAGVTTYTATRLTGGVQYWFEVRAVNAAGASAYAGPVAGTPQ